MMATCNNSVDHVPESEATETGEDESNKVDSSTEAVEETELNDVAAETNHEPMQVDTENATDVKSAPQEDTPAPVIVAKAPIERRRKGRRHRRRKIGMPRSPRSNNCHSPKAKIAKLDGQSDVNGSVLSTNTDDLNDKTNDENAEHSKETKDVCNSEGTLNARPKRNASIDKKPIVMEMRETRSKTKASEEARNKNSVPKTLDENKPRTIIVTETKSLAQVINNAVRKDGRGNQESGKPTLVIIETKSPSEVITMSSKPAGKMTNTITLETGLGKNGSATTLTPVGKLSSLSNTTSKIGREVTVTAASSVAQQLTPSVIEDGGMAVEVPSLVVPYLIEYPPSRTISEFLKMLPLDPKEIKELEEASKKKSLLAASASNSTQSNNPYYSGSGRPRAVDRWGAYFDSSLGKFFSEIGLSLAKEWVQTDLVRSQQRKAEKEGRSSRDRTVEVLMKGLNDTKEKNEPYHFSMMKCVHCNFKTESLHVMNRHYDFPHEHHMEFKCNFCTLSTRIIKDIIFHMEAEHGVHAKVERPQCFFQCPLCDFEDNSRAKVSKHTMKCAKKFVAERNLAPTSEFDPPAKRAKVYPIIPHGVSMLPSSSASKSGSTSINQQLFANKSKITLKPKDMKMSIAPNQGAYRTLGSLGNNVYYRSGSMVYSQSNRAGSQVYVPSTSQQVMLSSSSSSSASSSSQIYQVLNSSGQLMSVGSFGQVNNQRFTILPTATSNSTNLSGGPTPVALVPNIASAGSGPRSVLVGGQQRLQPPKPNISITPVTNSGKTSVLQQRTRLPTPSATMAKLGVHNASSFVVCEICDGYIKDLEQLRTHMQWIHKVKIHPKMIFNRPPLNCQKCQFRFFTDQGLERHLLGAHGLVTSSMQENANKGQDSGRCTICGKVFQWKLLAHMSKDHNMILKPAHLSYKCTVCAATFGMYKLFETHVYQAHSTVAKRVLDAPDEKKDCGMSFDGRVGEVYLHWQKEHLKPCQVKVCRVDKCEKCLSQSGTSLNKGDDRFECLNLHDNCLVSDAESVGAAETTATSAPTASSAASGGGSDSVKSESKKQGTESKKTEDKVVVSEKDVDPAKGDAKTDRDRVSDEGNRLNSDKSTTATAVVEDGDETMDDEDEDEDDDDEETALDMEVESHDVDHHSQDSIHTDEDDNDELVDEEEQATPVF